MTLIAIACKGDSAEFVTDSLAYTKNMAKTGHTTKSAFLHHLDAAVLTQGHSIFGVEAKSTIFNASLFTTTFDELLTTVPDQLHELWGQLLKLSTSEMSAPTIFLIGYSEKRKKFDAYYLPVENDFEPTRISGLFLMPAPFTNRPEPLEVGRLEREMTDDGHVQEFYAKVLGPWRAKPKRPVPRDIAEWARVGIDVRDSRALQEYARTPIGGKLYFTRLKRGESSTMEIFEFDDHGDEWLKLVEGTKHPMAQVQPCGCGSGKRYVDCHLAPHLDEPCECGEPGTFRECCMVRQPDSIPAS